MLKRDVRLICAHGMLTHMLFLLPVINPYYVSIGLTFRDFLIGEAVFSAFVLLSEVPSGWMSDTWKRRSTLVLGGFFAACGYMVLLLADGFWMATAAQAIIGIAIALNSGTNTALLYDLLHQEGREEEYRRIDGKRHGCNLYATAFSCLGGAMLFSVHPKLPLVFDIIALCAAMVSIARVREPARFRKSVERHLFHDMWVTMKYALSGHPEITGIILVSTVTMCTTKLMLWTQQPYYAGAGLPVAWYGVILAATFVLGGLAGQYSHVIENRGSNRAALGVIAVMLGASCLVLSLVTSVWVGIVLFFTGTLAYAVSQPRINAGINSRVGPERRATILSTASLMVHMLFIPTSVIVGALSEKGGVSDALLWMAAQVLLLSSVGLYLWGRNGRQAASSIMTGT